MGKRAMGAIEAAAWATPMRVVAAARAGAGVSVGGVVREVLGGVADECPMGLVRPVMIAVEGV